jgi:hypothetical protein
MDMSEDALDAVMTARTAFGGKRGQLNWALDFAQQDLDGVPPGRLADFCLQLTAFTSAATTGELFSEEALRDAHKEFRRIISAFVGPQQTVEIRYPEAVVRIGRTPRGRYRHVELGPDMMFTATQAAEPLTVLLTDADLPEAKACRAPKSRGAWDEVCGKWFAGRPNQTYCSALCQNRATTRATRLRAKGHTSEDEALALDRMVNHLRGRLRGAQIDPAREGLSPADARRIIVRYDRRKRRRGRAALIPYVLDVARPFLFRLDALEVFDRQGDDRLGALLGILREHQGARINGDGSIVALVRPAEISAEGPTHRRPVSRPRRKRKKGA